MSDCLTKLEPHRIALIKPSALGDIVHSLPVLTALRQRWPAAHITWVVNRAYEALVAGHPHLNATLPFDRASLKRGPWTAAMTGLQFARQLRSARFDLAIDLQGLLRTGLMTWATQARHRIGFANAREGARRFYTDRIMVPDAGEIHAVDRYWRIVEAIGAADHPKQFIVPIDEASSQHAEHLLQRLPKPHIMVAAGARWTTKRWPIENFAVVAQLAVRRHGGSVIFVGGREDRKLTQRAINQIPMAVNLCGETSLPVLAAVLNRADLMIANDTGPLHLAAALGRPVVAPYTCTQIRRHGPYGQRHRGVSAAIDCHGSYLRSCSHLSCMATLPPESLWPNIDEILSPWRLRHSA